MPNWNTVLSEIQATGSTYDAIRRKHMRKLFRVSGRNAIAYYSGWLQKSNLPGQGISFAIDDADKNGFMAAIHKMDRTKGLDLILHTPGGSVAATESIIDYLRSMFGKDIRAIVPQLALSAGTMISLACKEVVMGKHSSLGPIDPQINGMPAHAIKETFARAVDDAGKNQFSIHFWQPIIAKYHPTLIVSAEKAIDWSTQLVKENLVNGMFDGDPDADAKAGIIVSELGDHSLTKAHDRHISASRARALGIKIVNLEENQALQDAVLSVHHAFTLSLSSTAAFKIIENHSGSAYVQQIQQVHVVQN